jgi:hypothetical protein
MHIALLPAGSKAGLLQRTFLLACPAPPPFLELDQIFKAAMKGLQLVARGVVSAAVHSRSCST